MAQAYDRTRSTLHLNGIAEASLEAELLLMGLLDIDRSTLLAYPDRTITSVECLALHDWIIRRVGGEPLSYISGHKEFYGLDLLVNHKTFIPRPETETLVDLALNITCKFTGNNSLRIVDIGTGSGAIAVALATRLLSAATIYATDISRCALSIAKLNAERHDVKDRVVFLQGDLFDPLPGKVDIVVSNPPYIPTSEIQHLQNEVQREPHTALDGDQDGLAVVSAILSQVPKKIRKPGYLVMEVGHDQADRVGVLAKDLLPPHVFTVYQDLAGVNRFIMASIN